MTTLITPEQRAQLLANGRESLQNPGFDPVPVVKLFTPDAGATWLLTEIDPDHHDHAFGLCDLGLGYPELGWVSLAELVAVRGRLGSLNFISWMCAAACWSRACSCAFSAAIWASIWPASSAMALELRPCRSLALSVFTLSMG